MTPRALHRAAPLALALASAVGCQRAATDHHQGYVEGELVYVAAPVGGELVELFVERGREVEADAPLFRLDPEPQALRVAELEQRAAQARARLADLGKGARPSELRAIEARLERAVAAHERAQRDHTRRQELFERAGPDAVSAEELDRTRIDVLVQAAERAAAEAEFETAQLGGRPDALDAASTEVGALEASLEALVWELDQKRAGAPAAGLVEDTLYRVGEYVPAGRPVVALLPPQNLKLRFFVPQAALPTIAVGDAVWGTLDGLAERVPATISYISARAEFTPPVIYSKETRSKLVFLVEARPDPEWVDRLRPGQPLEVRLDGPGP